MIGQSPLRPPVQLSKPPGLRWWILGWALVAGMINYMDRSAVSIAAPSLLKELGLTRTDLGLMGTVFAWSYALAQLPSGWLVDRFGVRRMYCLAIAAWSGATALMAFGTHLWQFLLFRALLGVAEAPNGPASSRITADWFPRSERGQAAAIWDSGSKWGPALAPPILTAILLFSGWRAIFASLGIVGLVFSIAFFIFYRPPDEEPRLTTEELAHIRAEHSGASTVAAPVAWATLFRHRQVWGMMGGYFCIIWLWNLFIVFLPLYLHEARGITVAATGWAAAIPYLGAGVIGITGGYVMTWYTRRTGFDSLRAKRHILSAAGLVAGAVVILIPSVQSLTVTIVLMTLALGLVATMAAAAWAMPGDIVDRSQVATLGAIQNFGGYFGGALSPLLTGIIADRTGSYTPSFILGGAIAAAAGLWYSGLVRRPLGS